MRLESFNKKVDSEDCRGTLVSSLFLVHPWRGPDPVQHVWGADRVTKFVGCGDPSLHAAGTPPPPPSQTLVKIGKFPVGQMLGEILSAKLQWVAPRLPRGTCCMAVASSISKCELSMHIKASSVPPFGQGYHPHGHVPIPMAMPPWPGPPPQLAMPFLGPALPWSCPPPLDHAPLGHVPWLCPAPVCSRLPVLHHPARPFGDIRESCSLQPQTVVWGSGPGGSHPHNRCRVRHRGMKQPRLGRTTAVE